MNFGIFILGFIGFGMAGLIIAFAGNKILNHIKKDNYKTEKELKEGEKKEHE